MKKGAGCGCAGDDGTGGGIFVDPAEYSEKMGGQPRFRGRVGAPSVMKTTTVATAPHRTSFLPPSRPVGPSTFARHSGPSVFAPRHSGPTVFGHRHRHHGGPSLFGTHHHSRDWRRMHRHRFGLRPMRHWRRWGFGPYWWGHPGLTYGVLLGLGWERIAICEYFGELLAAGLIPAMPVECLYPGIAPIGYPGFGLSFSVPLSGGTGKARPWSSAQGYDSGDRVAYKNRIWKAIDQVPAGILPSVNHPEYWRRVKVDGGKSAKRRGGGGGLEFADGDEWDPERVYHFGDIVQYKGNFFQSVVDWSEKKYGGLMVAPSSKKPEFWHAVDLSAPEPKAKTATPKKKVAVSGVTSVVRENSKADFRRLNAAVVKNNFSQSAWQKNPQRTLQLQLQQAIEKYGGSGRPVAFKIPRTREERKDKLRFGSSGDMYKQIAAELKRLVPGKQYELNDDGGVIVFPEAAQRLAGGPAKKSARKNV